MTNTALPPGPSAIANHIKLVVADMDGTLLDETGAIPAAFWPVLQRLNERGITFAPASGRQYPVLAKLFGSVTAGLGVISENGAFVVCDGQEVSCSTVGRDFSHHVVRCVRQLALQHNVGLVWSGRSRAYVERGDAPFLAEPDALYSSFEVVEDLLEVSDAALKFSLFDFAGASASSKPALAQVLDPFQVVTASAHWTDIMDPSVNKGVALRTLQASLNASADETIVFGDYLNDLEMFAEATHTFAMANAHPMLLSAARYVAPSNREHGVITTLSRWLGSTGPSEASCARRGSMSLALGD